MIKTELFKDYADFAQYVDGLQSDTTYEQLKPSVKVAADKLSSIISDKTFETIAKAGDKEDLAEPYDHLRTAVASMAMHNYQIFSTTKKNGTDNSLYKYQHEEIKRHYLEAFWSAADNLLTWLDDHKNTGDYDKSASYTERQALPVKSAEEFERYFQIGGSAYFFSQIIYLIRDSWEEISSYLRGHEEEEYLELAKKAMCYDVISKVVATFDRDLLPQSIRIDAAHEYSKDDDPGNDRRSALSRRYAHYSKSVLDTLQQRLRKPADGSALDDLNEEGDKFFMTI